MQRYTDPDGRGWDIVLGRESFGALVALFVPVAGNAEPMRQSYLSSESHTAAETELDALDDRGLDALFQRSKPKEMQ